MGEDLALPQEPTHQIRILVHLWPQQLDGADAPGPKPILAPVDQGHTALANGFQQPHAADADRDRQAHGAGTDRLRPPALAP